MAGAPAEIGPYKILSTLGKGGMATVYKGEHRETGRIVAVKIMSTAYTERKDMALRFRREFRAIQRLSHPNIVQVLDAGEVHGSFYFAMEYVDGVDLARYFSLRAAGKSIRTEVLQAPGRVRKVLEVAAQTAEALLFIHSERIVHRDMKPTNTFVTKDGTVKLMDFGIAKELDQTAALTRHGSFLGTAYYTAPEQIRASRDLDGRADLYGLGVMLYEALAGKLPFFSDNTVEVLRMHILDPPPPMAGLNPALPADACQVVMKLLAKDPQERYRDAAELLDALRRCADFPKNQETREWAVPDVARRPVVASGLIGRQKDLARLVDAMDAVTVGQPVLVSLLGPLGIGKSRLLRALEEHARAGGILFLAGRYGVDRAGPYLAWREVLSGAVSHLMGFGIPFARKVAGDHARVLRSIAPAFERMEDGPAPARLAPEEDRLRLFESTLAFVRSLQRHVPVCILLDNVQWAYDADYELVAFLLRGLAAARSPEGGKASGAAACSVMVALAYRDDEVPVDHALRKVLLARPEGLRYLEMRLQPYTAEEVRQLVLAVAGGLGVLGSAEVLDRVVRRIMTETAGNPYHAEELAKALLGAATPAAPLVATVSASEPEPPPSRIPEVEQTKAGIPAPKPGSAETTRRNVGDFLRARIKALSDAAQKVLMAAAVIGEGIEFDLLAQLAEIDEDQLLDVIDELIRDKFLVERDRGDTFDFNQGLARDSVYAGIPEESRARLHGRMVALLRERARSNPDGYAALLALHAERAADQKEAAASYLAAGDAALRGNRVDEAERYFDKARQLGAVVPTDASGSGTGEIEIEVRRGAILLARGEPLQASKVFEAAMTRAKEKGDTRRAGELALQLGIAYARSGNHVLAVANLEWALSVARMSSDEELEASARDGLGSAQLVRGNFDRALEHMRAALALRRAHGDRVGATRALHGAARALAAKGELASALKMHRDALQFSQALSETAGAARGHAEIGELCRLLGEPAPATEHFHQALELGRKASAKDVEIAVLTSMGQMALGRGDVMASRRNVEEAIQLARGSGDLKLLAHGLLAFGDEALVRFDLSAAKGRYEEARHIATSLGDRVARAASARALAMVALRAKALDSARAYLAEARQTHEKIGAQLGLVEDMVAEGVLARAEAVAQTSSTGGSRSQAGRSMLEPCLEALRAALPRLKELGAVLLRAQVLVEAGELHLALRQAPEAVAAAEEAFLLSEACALRDLSLRARLLGGRAHLLARDATAAGTWYREALEILKANASQIPDRTERLAYLAEPDRRSLVEEVKALAASTRRKT